MDIFRRALSAYLEQPGRTQGALADKIGRSQASVNRYVKGERFPDAETARDIEAATDGAVSFETWRAVAAERFLGEAA